MIPLFKVPITAPDTTTAHIGDVLASGYIGEGNAVMRFENALGSVLESSRIVAVNSGTSALELAYELAGFRGKKSIVCTPMTCAATTLPLVRLGCRVLWADVDPMTGLLDPDSVSGFVNAPLVTVDFGGRPCDYGSLRKLFPMIVEDAAHAFGATYRGASLAQAGGDYVAWSFQAIKHVTCGDGGALHTPLADFIRARRLRWFGLDRDKGESFRGLQDIREAGFKFHMNDVAATIGLQSLKTSRERLLVTRQRAKQLCSFIEGMRSTRLRVPPYDEGSSYWLFIVHVSDRPAFIAHMATWGIQAGVVHRRNDTLSVFREQNRDDYDPSKLKGLAEFERTWCAIPCGWWITSENAKKIEKALEAWVYQR